MKFVKKFIRICYYFFLIITKTICDETNGSEGALVNILTSTV